MYKCFCDSGGKWSELVTVIWKDINPEIDVPKRLLYSIQEPLMTRWWTIGKLAQLIVEFYEVIKCIAAAIVNSSKTADKENKISSGLISLLRQPLIHCDLLFIAAFANGFLNPHMKWYSREDPNIGEPGFLVFHRAIRYFIMHCDLKDLQEGGWQEHLAFQDFKQFLPTLSNDDRGMKISMAQKFFQCALQQTKKHNDRYIKTRRLFFSCFGEPEISKFVAQLVLGNGAFSNQGWLSASNENFVFFSKIHQRTIDLQRLIDFLQRETLETIEMIRSQEVVERFKVTLQKISEGFNIWDRTNDETEEHRLKVLQCFSAQCSNQQNNERLVKATTYIKRTGKSEKKANIYGIASNGFAKDIREESFFQEAEADPQHADHQHELFSTKRVKRYYQDKVFQLHTTVIEKLQKLAFIARDMGGQTYTDLHTQIHQNLTSNEQTHLEKRKKRKLNDLAQKCHQQPDNAIIRRTGVDIQPRLRGMVVFSELRAKLHTKDLEKELSARNIVWRQGANFTEMKWLILNHERLIWQQSHPGENQENFNTRFFKVVCGDHGLFQVDDD